MIEDVSFGQIVKEHRGTLGLTQTELARRVGCAAITVRKIEAGDLRPSVQMAELIALALNIPEEEQLAFVRLARADQAPSSIPTPSLAPGEIGMMDLSGRARAWWTVACLIQGWHFFEHLLLQVQWLTGIYLFGAVQQTGILQLWIPRVELHFLYNTLVFLPLLVGLYFYTRDPA